MLRRSIRALLPSPVRRRLQQAKESVEYAREFMVDWRQYRQSSAHKDHFYLRNRTSRQLEAQIVKDYHRIEKGLALANPRQPFGRDVERRLIDLLPTAQASQRDAGFVIHAEDALEALRRWNESGIRSELIAPLQASQMKAFPSDLADSFFASRRSVRNFDPTHAVTRQDLIELTRTASCTPSVCNRQSARVHFFTDSEKVQQLLAHQNGNAGFREEVPALAIVSVDRRLFAGAAERNQRWIDGGLFAMTLVWAMHARGLASCMLNWSMLNAQSAKLRAAAGLPVHEDIVVLIAFGKAAAGHRYARSPRRDVTEISRIVD